MNEQHPKLQLKKNKDFIQILTGTTILKPCKGIYYIPSLETFENLLITTNTKGTELSIDINCINRHLHLLLLVGVDNISTEYGDSNNTIIKYKLNHVELYINNPKTPNLIIELSEFNGISSETIHNNINFLLNNSNK